MLIHPEAHAKILSISEDKRWWLGGFLDGDACVSAVLDNRTANAIGIRIVLGHSILTKDTLSHVHEQLGGSTPRFARAAEGNRREAWEWRIDGKYAAQIGKVYFQSSDRSRIRKLNCILSCIQCHVDSSSDDEWIHHLELRIKWFVLRLCSHRSSFVCCVW